MGITLNRKNVLAGVKIIIRIVPGEHTAPTDELLRELRDLLGPKQVALGYHPVLSDHREAKNGGMESFLNSRGSNGNGKGKGGPKGGKNGNAGKGR